jgi:predicted Zn-dependent peptidase
MPSEYLKLALEVLGDMIKNPKFDEAELEKERKVIFEEIKMRKDNPRVYVLDEINRHLYDGPFGSSLIGTYETMNSISRKKIIEKFKKIYTPNNLILCVVGDADFDEIINFVEKNFGKENGEVPEIEIIKINNEKIEKRKGIDQANLIFAHHVPIANDEKNYAAEVLNCLLAGGMSSKLFLEIREKRNLAYSVKGESNINKRFAYNLIYVGTTKDKVDEIKKIILEEFEKVAKSLEEKELNEIKKQLIGNYHISMEDSHNQMVQLFLSEISGNANEFYEFEKNIREVKLKDVKDLAKNATEKYSFFALVPED